MANITKQSIADAFNTYVRNPIRNDIAWHSGNFNLNNFTSWSSRRSDAGTWPSMATNNIAAMTAGNITGSAVATASDVINAVRNFANNYRHVRIFTIYYRHRSGTNGGISSDSLYGSWSNVSSTAYTNTSYNFNGVGISLNRNQLAKQSELSTFNNLYNHWKNNRASGSLSYTYYTYSDWHDNHGRSRR
jgi:hypothetical protein